MRLAWLGLAWLYLVLLGFIRVADGEMGLLLGLRARWLVG